MATLDSDVTMTPVAEGSTSAVPSSSSKTPKRFEIKKWNAVALWAWDTLLWTIAPSAGITSWIFVLNAKLTKLVPLVRNALSHGGSATMPSTSIASAAGSKLVKSAHWITASGSSRNMVTD